MCTRILLDQTLHKTKMLRHTKTRFLLGLLTHAWFGSYILKWYMIVMSNILICSVASDVASFDGRAALIYRLTAWPKWSEKDIISLKFKTRKSSGMLLHAEGQRDHNLNLMLDKGQLLLYHQQGAMEFFQYFNVWLWKSQNIHTIYTLYSNIKMQIFQI